LNYQKAGIAALIARRNALLADEMGLGKTVQAAGLINYLQPSNVLIVCPAGLKINWQRELEKWLVAQRNILIVDGRGPLVLGDGGIIICSYEMLSKHREIIQGRWDLFVMDECHYLKNSKAQRTRAAFAVKASRKLAMTGTPILNRPVEIQPILAYLDAPFAKNWRDFVLRYCGAYFTKYGWVTDGATNVQELGDRMRGSVMIRRQKQDVLTELPPKRRQIVEISSDSGDLKAQIDRERSFVQKTAKELAVIRGQVAAAKAKADADKYRDAVKKLRIARKAQFEEMAMLRHETALMKVPFAADMIVDALKSVDKLVVFAHHHDVILRIQKELSRNGVSCVTATGETPVAERQNAIDRFQNDAVHVFLGSIQACGTGITLTAASHVIFVEFDWTPSRMTQAEDRCHRIGQRDIVFVQHLVVDGSIDAQLAKVLVRKQDIIDAILDTKIP
jgi:SWI/SNF-related matrix-associated actin-dependent regulator 1 of chromatin subfamily A